MFFPHLKYNVLFLFLSIGLGRFLFSVHSSGLCYLIKNEKAGNFVCLLDRVTHRKRLKSPIFHHNPFSVGDSVQQTNEVTCLLIFAFDEGERILILPLLAGSDQILFWSIFGGSYGQ